MCLHSTESALLWVFISSGTACRHFATVRSYLAQRTFCVWLNDFRSFSLSCGIPQGSLLGPLLCSLYLLSLDPQVYVPLKHKDAYSIQTLFEFLEVAVICLISP